MSLTSTAPSLGSSSRATGTSSYPRGRWLDGPDAELLRQVAARDSRVRSHTRAGWARRGARTTRRQARASTSRGRTSTTGATPTGSARRWPLDAHPEVGVVGGYYVLVRREPRRALRPDAAHGAPRHRAGHGAVHSLRPHDRDLSPAGLGRRRRLSRGGRSAWTCGSGSGGQTRLAVRKSRGAGRALRPLHQLLPPARSSTSIGSGTSPGYRRRSSASSGSRAGCTCISMGRHAYAYLPHGLKRVLRQRIGGSRERDV